MSVKLLTEHHLEFLSIKGGCTGSSETTLVKITHCWKSRYGSNMILHKKKNCLQHMLPEIHIWMYLITPKLPHKIDWCSDAKLSLISPPHIVLRKPKTLKSYGPFNCNRVKIKFRANSVNIENTLQDH